MIMFHANPNIQTLGVRSFGLCQVVRFAWQTSQLQWTHAIPGHIEIEDIDVGLYGHLPPAWGVGPAQTELNATSYPGLYEEQTWHTIHGETKVS